MLTTCITGAIRNARNAMNVIKSPSVMWFAAICRAPTYHTIAPTIPISTVADRLISDIAVSDLITLSSSRCTPPAKTSASRSSA